MLNIEKHLDSLRQLKDHRFMVSTTASGTEKVYHCDSSPYCTGCIFYYAHCECDFERLFWLFSESEE